MLCHFRLPPSDRIVPRSLALSLGANFCGNQSHQNASKHGKRKRGLRQSDSGQIIVEYVLLLVLSVSLAIIISKTMISPRPDNPGFILSAWDAMVKQIGIDYADDAKP